MTEMAGDDASALCALNVLLGALVAGAVLAIVVAALQDVFARRRMRGPLPDAWPPSTDSDE